jgi:1,4-dihydroxy-6-naphthoate synthase
MEIRVAHSPDSDDAFMFYALASGKLPTGDYHFIHVLEDIESLNQKAVRGVYEVTAISIHAYAYVSDKYALLPSGASMGDRYGPIVVSREPWDPADMPSKKIAVPGTMTSAYLALKLFQPNLDHVVLPFDQIMDAVQRGVVDGGLLIHEGQLTYAQAGLKKIIDLGEWWNDTTGLPLPLGGNAIRRDLGMTHIRQVSRLIKESIRFALDHREDALQHAMKYARDLNPGMADRFVGMYVNQRTLDYGEEGRKAVWRMLQDAYDNKLIPSPVNVEFVE